MDVRAKQRLSYRTCPFPLTLRVGGFAPRHLSRYVARGMPTMNTPESMKADLAAWNNGQGIDLESWIGCVGNFSLAVGYLSVFCPEFVEFEGYILREGFSEDSLRGFEESCAGNKKAVEAVINHLHIEDIQHYDCEDLSKDKVVLLGSKLKVIYEAKLQWQFPNKPCIVSFYEPEDEDDLMAYEITFWQKAYENQGAT